jgi:phosphate transport system substrate-binding protein
MRQSPPPENGRDRAQPTKSNRRAMGLAAISATAVALLLTACGSSSNSSSATTAATTTTAAATTTSAAATTTTGASSAGSGGSTSGKLSGTLNGSGSTFQLSFQQSAIQAFKSVQPKLTVNYGGGGSGKGRSDLASGVVNFAGSDSPIPASEQSTFKGTVLYFPVVIGPITVSYNLSGVSKLKLSGPVLAQIFEAKITKWNNSAIAADNPGVKLPSQTITIARRSDSSGTTANFSQFLMEASAGKWTLGSGSTISWPTNSVGGNGNGGVAQIVKSTKGAIGYVDYADAKAAGLTFASVKNQAGAYIAPSPASASVAASHAKISPNLTFSAIWAPGAGSYPITYQSWDLVYQKQSNANLAKGLQSYIGYLVGRGQKLLPGLGYAPLPSNLQKETEAQLPKITS